jgi:hypothetical protein
MFRQLTLEDMRTALMEVRISHPRLSIENCMEILKREQPELVQASAYGRRRVAVRLLSAMQEQ